MEGLPPSAASPRAVEVDIGRRTIPGLNQENLKRVISLPQAIGIAFHQTVGGGVMALTGVAIAMTGGGTPLAYLLAALSTVIVTVPFVVLGSAMPVAGGSYTYSARLFHPFLGYFNTAFAVMAQTGLGIFGFAAGQYMHSLDPFFDPKIVAVSLISAFYVANMFGAVISARLGIYMAVVMIIAMGWYIVAGVAAAHGSAYPSVLPHGIGGLLRAAALLTFAMGGATSVVELGREMKRPGRNIPITVFSATGAAALLYMGIALATVWAAPPEAVANQPLSVAGAYFLPPAALHFFIIGGAMVALIGTMNAQLLAGSKGMLAAVDDGWLPHRVGAVNKRFGTPHFLLTGLYVIGLLPVLFDIPVGVLASGISGIAQFFFVLLIAASLRLRYVYPELHRAAPFRLKPWLHWTLSLIGIAVSTGQAYLLLAPGLSLKVWIATLVAFLVIGLWGVIRYPHVRRTLAERAKLASVACGVPASS
ncbi:MAG TPA: APC family permease [Sphingomonadaceae bacterium]